MTDKEINEYLAEHMFGLVRQKDFGEWEEHDWRRNNKGEIDEFEMCVEFHNGPMCNRCYHSFCMHCSDDYERELHEGPCVVEAPDYILNIKEVIDKAQMIVIKREVNREVYEVHFNGYKAEDIDFGKAICLSAIEWLKGEGA